MKNSNEFVSTSRRIDPHNNTMNSLRWASIPSPTRNGKGIGGVCTQPTVLFIATLLKIPPGVKNQNGITKRILKGVTRDIKVYMKYPKCMTQGAQILETLEHVLSMVFNPGVLTVLITIYGLIKTGFLNLTKKMTDKQDAMLEVLTKRIDDIEKREEKFEKSIKRELIRQEFKSAIESDSVTERELFDIYEQYKELGLTEYDKRRMEQYLEQKDSKGAN